MKKQCTVLLLLIGALVSCTKKSPRTSPDPDEKKPPELTMTQKAEAFLLEYNQQFEKLEGAWTQAFWKAANSGKSEDFDESGRHELALRSFHSSPEKFQQIQQFLEHGKELPSLVTRQLEVAKLAFQENQLPADMLRELVEKGKEIEKTLTTFRGKVGGKEYSNNQLQEMLTRETNSARRKAIWEALKQVGGEIGPKIVELARLRNEAAKKVGFENFWEMRVVMQEHEPELVLSIFRGLEEKTTEPFSRMKAVMDAQIARKLKVKPADLRPWHYDNPFFQEAPPSADINMDVFFNKMSEQDIVDLSVRFFGEIGLPMEDLAAKSDFFERPGKDQHAFCISMNRADDVRMLLNIKPTAYWTDTMLHEAGHAVYYKWIQRELPFNLREAAHILTTEGVAMMFGALAKNPTWLQEYAKADPKFVAAKKNAIINQRKLEQLIFARWAMVMLYFEKALYENPDQDLNKLWWDLVERLQLLKRPEKRDQPDWASKAHFTIAPVYYHNYALGELFAAQMRAAIAEMVGHEGPVQEMNWNKKEIGQWLIENVFSPGMKTAWPLFVEQVTQKALSADAFASEVK